MWLDGFSKHVVKNKTGTQDLNGLTQSRAVRKILLHTTEGSSAEGAFAAYKKRAGKTAGVHPHFTVDAPRRKRFQHLPVDRASYALRKLNREGIIQIEIVGRAAESHNWADEDLDWLAHEVLAPILVAHPGILTNGQLEHANFLGERDGLLAAPHPRGKARMTERAFIDFRGIVGHQHAPFDDHWDPGRININRLVKETTLRYRFLAGLDQVQLSSQRFTRSSSEKLDDRPTIIPIGDSDDMIVLKDTTTKQAWVATNGRARPLSDPDNFDYDGPVRSSSRMELVVKDLYTIVNATE